MRRFSMLLVKPVIVPLTAILTVVFGPALGLGEEPAAAPAGRPRMTMLESSGEDPLAEVEKQAQRTRVAARRALKRGAVVPAHAVGPLSRQVDPAASKAAAARGILFLANAQHPSGGWNSQGQPDGQADLANTSIAGLALLKTPPGREMPTHEGRVRKAADFVVQQVMEAGLPGRWQPAAVDRTVSNDLGGGSDAALAALFLAEQVAARGDDAAECREAAGRLLQYLDGQLQGNPGVFRQRAQGLSRAVVAHAAEVGKRAGVTVPENLVGRAVAGVAEEQGLYGLAARVGCLHAASREAGGDPSADAEARAVAERVVQPVLGDYTGRWPYGAGGEVFLSLMFLGAMLTDAGGPTAMPWSRDVDTMLVQAQNQDGSWTGSSCINSRVFCTSSAVLVMGTAPPDDRVASR